MCSLWKLTSLCFVSWFLVFISADDWIGPGLWKVVTTDSCEDAERYPYTFELVRRKINRTHEALQGHFAFPGPVDDNIGIRIVVCKFVDGGCKPYRIMQHVSFPELCKKYIAHNIEEILTLSGVDPPDFPVPAGEYTMDGYLFNYEELPEKSAYGSFRAELYLIKDYVEVSCLVLLFEFNEIENES